MIKAIFVNAGRGLGPTGAIDNGAAGNGTTERKEVVETAQQLITRLHGDANLQGIEILEIGVESRLMLKDAIAEVNTLCTQRGWKSNDAILLSIHANSAADASARGVEAWYPSLGAKPGSQELAKAVVEQVCQLSGMPMRSVPTLDSAKNRWGRLGILDDTTPIACLIEIGFLTNEFDATVLKNLQTDTKVADGLHRGIRAWMSLPPMPGAAAAPAFFKDVPELAWYAQAVRTCYDAGIFQMSADGMFHAAHPITRGELAATLARLLTRMPPR